MVADPTPTPLAEARRGPQKSIYDTLVEEVEAEELPPLVLKHPLPHMAESGWTLTFRTDIDYKSEYKKWLDQATPKTGGKNKEVDSTFLNRLIIANTCIAISKDGEVMVDDEGPVDFTTPGFVSKFGGKAVDAVKGFIRLDGGIASLAGAVISAAGYGQDAENVEDPKE